jgi:methylglyoxal synthase
MLEFVRAYLDVLVECELIATAPHPHEPDIHALMKICDVHGVPLATNTATAALCLDAAVRLAAPV